MKLLIVDDEPIIVRGLQKLLDYASLGYETVLASSDSKQALELIRSEKPDVLLSDIVMPSVSGLVLLEELRRVKGDSRAIFLSGFPNFEYAQTALSLGAMDYLLKPVDQQKLSELLARAHGELLESREKDALQQQLQRLRERKPEQNPFTLLQGKGVSANQSLVCYCVLVFQMREMAGLNQLDYNLLRFSAYNKADSFAGSHGCISFVKGDYLVVIVQGGSDKEAMHAATAMGKLICERAEQELAVRLYYAHSDVLHDTQEIPQAYQVTLSALEAKRVVVEDDQSDIDRIKSYILNQYGKNLSLEVMAEFACMSPSYFSTYFRKQTGVGFKEYLTRIRIEAAEQLLLSTDLKIYEIAERVGFTDARYFSDTFRKATGMTPQDYKKEVTGS